MSSDRSDDGERHPTDGYETVDLGVLVIGAGAAGARTAIELVERGVDPDDVLVVGKRSHGPDDQHTEVDGLVAVRRVPLAVVESVRTHNYEYVPEQLNRTAAMSRRLRA